MEIVVRPLARIYNSREDVADDYWGNIESKIILEEDIPSEALTGIDQFSHLEILFVFDKVTSYVYAGHPRGNKSWPYVGIFAQRKKDRPNRIGSTIVQLIEKGDRYILVKGLDALTGTPVIDVKPVFKEFIPSAEINQPSWCAELMKDYWK